MWQKDKGKGMKHIFDWQREQMEDNSNSVGNTKLIGSHTARVIINRAEAKWENEYCKTWKLQNESFVKIHGTSYLIDDVRYWKCCPYCCRKIMVVESF